MYLTSRVSLLPLMNIPLESSNISFKPQIVKARTIYQFVNISHIIFIYQSYLSFQEVYFGDHFENLTNLQKIFHVTLFQNLYNLRDFMTSNGLVQWCQLLKKPSCIWFTELCVKLSGPKMHWIWYVQNIYKRHKCFVSPLISMFILKWLGICLFFKECKLLMFTIV